MTNGETPARARVLETYGSGPPCRIFELCDATGAVGGYVVTGLVMDGPVTYLDANGSWLGTFHIFSDPQKTEVAAGAIDALTKAFPNQRALSR